MRTCLHELDVVTLSRPAAGHGPGGERVTVPAGTSGTVVREVTGTPWLEVEVVDHATGAPRAFVEVERDHVSVLHSLVRGTA